MGKIETVAAYDRAGRGGLSALQAIRTAEEGWIVLSNKRLDDLLVRFGGWKEYSCAFPVWSDFCAYEKPDKAFGNFVSRVWDDGVEWIVKVPKENVGEKNSILIANLGIEKGKPIVTAKEKNDGKQVEIEVIKQKLVSLKDFPINSFGIFEPDNEFRIPLGNSVAPLNNRWEDFIDFNYFSLFFRRQETDSFVGLLSRNIFDDFERHHVCVNDMPSCHFGVLAEKLD